MTMFARPCVLLDLPPVLWWLSPGEGWDAVWVNCKKDATTENQGAGKTYMGLGGVCLIIECVLSDLT